MTADALLVVSYGGPRGPDDVLPFMRNATRGRGIPDERLVEVSAHYQLFGGVSPINARNAELVDALGAALAARGLELPIVLGNRNWTPTVADALRDLDASGARRVVVLATAAYASYSGCRQYREELAAALAETGLAFDLVKLGPFAETDGFVTANADALREALAAVPGEPRVLFVTHSIPRAMDAASGPAPQHSYAEQHRRVAARIAAQVGLDRDRWEIVYCSRSGAAHIPWLEPDVNDRIEELADQGVTSVVTVPFGFINDHMEVVYDLDTQAAATAARRGVAHRRAATAGLHPAFVAMLADAIQRAATDQTPPGEGAAGEPADPARSTLDGLRTCTAECCGSGRPGGPVPAAACSAPGGPGT